MCWGRAIYAATLLLVVAGCNAEITTTAPVQPAAVPPAGESAASPFTESHNALTYAGRFTQTSTYINGPTVHLAFGVNETINAGSTTAENHAAVDFSGTQTWTGPKTKNVVDFHAEVAQPRSQTRIGTDVTLLSVSTNDTTGLRTQTNNGAGAGVFDQLPEVPYARWTNAAVRTEVARTKGNFARATYAADGSYVASMRYADRKQSTINAYTDGAAIYQWPLGFNFPLDATIAFDPPSKREIGVTFTNPVNFPGQTMVFSIASWYPSQPVVLASDAFQNMGSATVPSSCAAPASGRRALTRLVENRTRLDVAFGQYETLQRTFYASSSDGLVCETIHDQLLTYYFYPSLWFSAKPIAIVTTDGYVALQSGRLATAALRDASVAIPLDLQLDTAQAGTEVTTARQMLGALEHLKEKR